MFDHHTPGGLSTLLDGFQGRFGRVLKVRILGCGRLNVSCERALATTFGGELLKAGVPTLCLFILLGGGKGSYKDGFWKIGVPGLWEMADWRRKWLFRRNRREGGFTLFDRLRPAGRASCSEGGHFVPGLPFLGRSGCVGPPVGRDSIRLSAGCC